MIFNTSGVCLGQQDQFLIDRSPTSSDKLAITEEIQSWPDSPDVLVDYDDSNIKSGPRRLSLQVGGGGAAFLGVAENVLFNRDNIGYLATSYLGFRFSRLRHSAGLFGAFGSISGSTARSLSGAYEMTITAKIDPEVYNNKYLDAGAGVMLWEMLRVSAGHSWAWVSFSDGGSQVIGLGTSTVGLQLRTGPVRWFINGTTYFDKNFRQFFVRPSAGLVFQFYMIRFY